MLLREKFYEFIVVKDQLELGKMLIAVSCDHRSKSFFITLNCNGYSKMLNDFYLFVKIIISVRCSQYPTYSQVNSFLQIHEGFGHYFMMLYITYRICTQKIVFHS